MLAVALQLLAGADGDDLVAGGDSTRETGRRRFVVPAALVARLRARDRAAYDELLDRAYEPLVAVAARIIGAHDAAEDVVQDIMVWVWEQGESWAPGASAAAYLIGAVRHRALNVLRARGVEARYRERMWREQGAVPARASVATDWAAETRELEDALHRALATLTERQRTAFLLRAEQRLTIPEVAESLGIGVRGAEKLVSRAMAVVRRALREVVEG